MQRVPTRKQPRDFVQLDEFWAADKHWPQYFFQQKIWVYADEYRAELDGDEDYSRIVIHGGLDRGWLFTRPLRCKSTVAATLQKIVVPVSQRQLQQLGFVRWHDEYI
ncbi:MAG: hypothetical protein ACI9WS_001135 [Paraglaciecola psychrophila]|mgnify:CR=1 FL=1|jgi:hypothetical protein